MRAITIGFAAFFGLTLIGQPSADAEESISLSFVWPEQFHAKVTATLQRKSRWVEMGRESTATISGTFEMRVDTDSAGQIHATFENPDLVVATGKAGKSTLTVVELIPLLPLTFQPTFVLSADATSLQVVDAEEFRSTLIDLIVSHIDDAAYRESIRDFVPRMVEQDTSDVRLQQLAALRWNGSVGLWQGQELAQGEVIRRTVMQPVPIEGQPVIPYQYQIRFVSRVPCSVSETTQQCVEVEMISEVADQDLRAIADAFFHSRPDVATDGTRYEYPEMRTEIRLVTDPDTLLPYRYRQSMRQGMKMIHDGSTTDTRSYDDLELIYMY